MRRVIVASLLLSPMLFTASAVASQPATDDVTVSTQPTRISTGVTAPTLLKSSTIAIRADAFDAILPPDAEVGLKVNVDEQGNARDIQVVKPVNADLDARVVTAVSKLRFTPGTLDNQAIPVSINLNVVVKH
ncbi:MAG: TonB family protein [Terracidiphilus sp.]